MKLNYKRTLCVGFAFFLICMFWQAYDNTIPMILTNKFGMSQSWSGFIMAMDNILALFMLPLFGALSDRSKNPRGRRTPFIVAGTIVAVIALLSLSFVDRIQLSKIEEVSKIDNRAALSTIYEAVEDRELVTPQGERFTLGEKFQKETFSSIPSTVLVEGKTKTNHAYTNYVVPARQAYVREITRDSKWVLFLFMAILLLLLLAMSTFRAPAVALMPDVTVKPLRSKANAVINLMGTAGGILILILGVFFKTSALSNSMMSYLPFFSVIGGLMITALVVFLFTVDEVKFVKEMREESRKYGLEEEEKEEISEKRDLGKGQFQSLLFLLASIVFWFMGYNAVTSKYSVYATTVLHKDYNLTLMIAQIAAIVSYLPVGIAASRIGRKKTIMAGVIMLAAAFLGAMTLNSDSPALLMNLFFALAGIAWATINVNSFPMVVEMCSGSDVGKYTGYYYTASMAAQVVTPILSGMLMDQFGMGTLFPYAAIFVTAAFVTMFFVRHGDSKQIAKTGLSAFEDMD